MNRGVLQSSPVQQMMAGNPNWWIINNNMRPPLSTSSTLHHQQQQILSPNYLPSSTNHLSPYSPFICTPPPPPSSCNSSSSPSSFSSNWHQEHQDQHQIPAESWSQLLLGGLVGCEDKGNNNNNMGIFQGKKMEDWEEQVLNHHQPQAIDVDDHVKQENSSSYVYEHATNDHHDHHLQDFQQPKPTTITTNWPPHQMMPITSSPNSSSLTSFSNNSSTNMLEFSTIKGDTTGRHPPPDRSSECNSNGTGGGAVKKAKVQASSTTGQTSFKVRKEKLGDRITALHQLVSPFGKTDTASVLLEAIGYIRFLQSQIEALSLPYLGSGSPNMGQQKSDSFEEPKKDLKSRGLCLVPVSCTLQVGSDNGADYWAPAIGGGFQ